MKKGISGSALKIIALISMTVDHGAYTLLGTMLAYYGITSVSDYSSTYIGGLLQQGSVGFCYLAYQVCRLLIGRLAFPIFIFLLVEGFLHTKSRSRYGARLFLFALLSEVPFDLAFYREPISMKGQNVFFTLLIGMLMLWGIESLEKRIRNLVLRTLCILLCVSAAAFLSNAIHADYRYMGILSIALLYLFRQNKGTQLIMGCASFFWEPTACLSFVPIAFYNGKRGLSMRYFFYLYYPLHLLAFYGLRKLLAACVL